MSLEEGPKCHVSKSSSKSLSHDEATPKDTALGCVSLGKLLDHPLPAFFVSRGVPSLVLVPSWLPGEWHRWCVCAAGPSLLGWLSLGVRFLSILGFMEITVQRS